MWTLNVANTYRLKTLNNNNNNDDYDDDDNRHYQTKSASIEALKQNSRWIFEGKMRDKGN